MLSPRVEHISAWTVTSQISELEVQVKVRNKIFLGNTAEMSALPMASSELDPHSVLGVALGDSQYCARREGTRPTVGL